MFLRCYKSKWSVESQGFFDYVRCHQIIVDSRSGSNAGKECKRWSKVMREKQWNFDKNCGNDVIIVVSKEDDKVNIGHDIECLN